MVPIVSKKSSYEYMAELMLLFLLRTAVVLHTRSLKDGEAIQSRNAFFWRFSPGNREKTRLVEFRSQSTKPSKTFTVYYVFFVNTTPNVIPIIRATPPSTIVRIAHKGNGVFFLTVLDSTWSGILGAASVENPSGGLTRVVR